MEKRRVIVITDGDQTACAAVERAAEQLGLSCISSSAGNPTPLSADEIVSLVMSASSDPVLVMVDDRGKSGKGKGETALEGICRAPGVEVIGVVVVASDTSHTEGITVTCSITRGGEVVSGPVDKYGNPEPGEHVRVEGDTVDVLNSLNVPIIVGMGDAGKMDGADDPVMGAPVTLKAITEILNRSGN